MRYICDMRDIRDMRYINITLTTRTPHTHNEYTHTRERVSESDTTNIYNKCVKLVPPNLYIHTHIHTYQKQKKMI